MYRVLCDDLPIYDLRDEELVLIEPKLDLEVNKSNKNSKIIKILILQCMTQNLFHD